MFEERIYPDERQTQLHQNYFDGIGNYQYYHADICFVADSGAESCRQSRLIFGSARAIPDESEMYLLRMQGTGDLFLPFPLQFKQNYAIIDCIRKKIITRKGVE